MSRQGSIPITSWDSPIYGTGEGNDASNANGADGEPFDDGGFEEYWEKMELLDLDETEIPLDQLECGSDREDFGSSMHSYLNDLSPRRDAPDKPSATIGEGQDYAALLEQVSEHLAGGIINEEESGGDNNHSRPDEIDYEDDDQSYGDEDYDDDDDDEQPAAVATVDDDDDLFDDYEEDVRNSQSNSNSNSNTGTTSSVVRALSRGGDGGDIVRVEASQEAYYSSDGDSKNNDNRGRDSDSGNGSGEVDEEYSKSLKHSIDEHSKQGSTGVCGEDSYADDYEDDDDDEGIEYGHTLAPLGSTQVIGSVGVGTGGSHVHAGYGIAPNGTGAANINIANTGLFSPTKMKALIDNEREEQQDQEEDPYEGEYDNDDGDDDDYNAYMQQEENEPRKRSSHSQSRTVDRSKFSAGSYSDGHPDSRGAEVIFSANSFGDDGADPVFTYKDFEFLPPTEEGEEEEHPKQVKRKPPHQQGKVLPGGRRKLVIDHGPAAPPKSNRAGPYNQEKLGPMPGIQQRKKKGKSVDPEQARRNKDNRDRHKMMLSMIALKRKEQEDEAIRLVMKEEAKRKRFKEALLEKAMRSRRQDSDEEAHADHHPTHAYAQPTSGKKEPKPTAHNTVSREGRREGSGMGKNRAPVHAPEEHVQAHAPRGTLMEPTKAFEAQKMPPRKRQEDAEDENERALKEEEKYEQVALMRRKFKEQHKQILLNMLVKKREADKKKEEEEKLEAHRAMIKKMKRDERLAQKAAASAQASEQPDVDIQPAPPIKPVKKQRRRPEGGSNVTAPTIADPTADNVFVTEAETAVEGGVFGPTTAATGGGRGTRVPLIRSRSQGESREELMGVAPTATSVAEAKKAPRPRRTNDDGTSGGDVGVDNQPSRRTKSAAVGAVSKASAHNTTATTADGQPMRIRRGRSRSEIETPTNMTHGTKINTGHSGVGGNSIGDNEDAQLQRNLDALDEELTGDKQSLASKQRRVAAMSAREKIDAQMKAVADQRRVAAEEEKKEQERMRRRVEKLAKRIVQEAHVGKQSGDSGAGDDDDELASRNEKTSKSKKVTPEMAEAMVARLQAKVQRTAEGIAQMSNASPPARDFVDWKRKHNVPPGAQVFSMTGWYPCVKDALLSRGWIFNSDPLSPYFDMKWTLRSSDIGLESLQPWQLTNHFLKNIAITTKVGLIKSLQQLVWQADISPDDIIPRGYDLTNPSELHAFITDFRLQKAEGLLKGLYAKLTGNNSPLTRPDATATRPTAATTTAATTATVAISVEGSAPSVIEDDIDINASSAVDNKSDDATAIASMEGEAVAQPPPALLEADGPRPFTARVLYDTPVPLPVCKGKDPSTLLVNKAVFEACCSVLERYLRPQDDAYIDSAEDEEDDLPMTPLEWELLIGHDLYTASTGGLADVAPEMLGAFGREIVGDEATGAADDPQKAQKYQAAQHRNKRKQRKIDIAQRSQAAAGVVELVAVGEAGLHRVHTLLYRLQALCVNQDALNGSGDNSKNIWIVKPAAKSRGRGITTFTDLDKLLAYCDVGQSSNTGGASMWIAQKYMENPMMIANRKFDMRQWVLVTDWNPLTIYFFDETYCRFSSEEYTTNEDSLDNAFVHLVNQSVNKNNQNKKDVVVAENGEPINGFMWSCEQFKKYLIHQSGGTDIWTEKMQPRMKEIARMTLGCAVDMIEHRKNSWELYGFDFMVDDEYNAWLIEVNSSPACDYSTPTTERYVQKALVELLSVTLDVRKWESLPRKDRGEKPDTGGWECIYKGPLLETPAASFGTDISVKGAAVKLPRRAPPPGVNNQFGPMSTGLNSNSFGEVPIAGKQPTSIKGPSGGKLTSIVRRQGSGVENAPRGGRRGNEEEEDNESVDIGDYAAVDLGAKTVKAGYDPSSIAKPTGAGSNGTRVKTSVKNIQHVVIKSQSRDANAFDDSDDDDDIGSAGSRNQNDFAGGGRNISKNSGSISSKKIPDTYNSVAVPVKLFAVDF